MSGHSLDGVGVWGLNARAGKSGPPIHLPLVATGDLLSEGAVSVLKVGDRVIVVRGCPGCDHALGVVYEVTGFVHGLFFRCSACGMNPVWGPDVAVMGPKGVSEGRQRSWAVPRPWVRKLEGEEGLADEAEAEFNERLLELMEELST